jgi:OmpA-OmpF porin, OOP family
MTRKTLYLLGIALSIILGTILYQKYCCNCTCKDDASTTAIDSTSSNVAMDMDANSSNRFDLNGNGFNYYCTDNFKFLKNDYKTIQPVSDSINLGIDNLKQFFGKNPNQKLMITGYATSEEKNTSAYPNLGEARANDIKNYFISKGFAASQFDTEGKIIEKWKVSNDTVFGPAAYKLIAKEESKEANVDWDAMKEKINANPLILYFNTGQSEINLSAEERQKVADLVHYLDNVDGAKLSAVGHTDGSGDRNINIKLGLERANFAKSYLANNGIPEAKIETSSKGPDEPIADNNTAEGKAKNRRTVVTIK